MKETIIINKHIPKSNEGLYFTLPFTVPENVAIIEITYKYMRHEVTKLTSDIVGEVKREINIIDLGVNSPDGFIGASGSNRTEIRISERDSSDGYVSTRISSGEWSIIVGAYKIAQNGVDVQYTVSFTPKEYRLYKGDTHMHSTGSDGVHTVSELARKAEDLSLDYIIVTDHNNYAHNSEITGKEPVTVIPGCEWTHYKGHCNMIGSKRPLKTALDVNDHEAMSQKVNEARKNGALVSINHPFCSFCGWNWGIDNTDFDMVEIWNGGINPDDNAKAVQWWHNHLCNGKVISVIGGSDYHSTEFTREIGQPTTHVWSLSNSTHDIIEALSHGHSFITFQPDAPGLYLKHDFLLGDNITPPKQLDVVFTSIQAGDVVHVISDKGVKDIAFENNMISTNVKLDLHDELFFRFEISRWSYYAETTILISNPVYFLR